MSINYADECVGVGRTDRKTKWRAGNNLQVSLIKKKYALWQAAWEEFIGAV